MSLLEDGIAPQVHPPALPGRLEAAARLGSLAVVVLALGLFAAALPFRAAELRTAAPPEQAVFQQLAPIEAQLLAERGFTLDQYAATVLALETLVVLAFAVVSGIVLWRKGQDQMGIFAALAAPAFGVYITSTLDALARAHPAGYLLSTVVQGIGLWCAWAFFYIFPTGRFFPRWTVPLAGAAAAWVGGWVLLPSVAYNPANPMDLAPPWFVAHLLWYLTGTLAQVQRFRAETNAVRRQQTRWVLVAMLTAVFTWAIFMVVRFAWPALRLPGPERLVLNAVVLPLYLVCIFLAPVSIMASILRYRLWDIDVFLNRALVYSLLTAVLAATYFTSVVALQLLFAGLASPLVVAASTLATAALFQPARRRVQLFIDRRFFRRKYDAAKTLAAFSADLRDDAYADLARLVARLEDVVTDTLQPAHVLTWLRTASGYAAYVLGADGQAVDGADPVVGWLHAAHGALEADRLDAGQSEALRHWRAARVALVVPLTSQGDLIGWLTLGPRLSESDYSADDRAFLSDLAVVAAPAVRVAHLVRQQQAEARRLERLDHEMAVARLVQHTLLPKTLTAPEGWQAAAYYQPARSVGGDFYDLVTLPDGSLGLFVGDVTDKGVPAALVMAAVRSLLRATAVQGFAPGELMRRVNDLLHPEIPENMFVTCFYAILEPRSGRLRYANAGHPLPLRQRREQVSVMKARGMPLGLLPGMGYEEDETCLEAGERLLFFSDGLVEARNARGELFGTDRLRALLPRLPDEGPALIQALLAELDAFVGAGAEQEDDVTLVMLACESKTEG